MTFEILSFNTQTPQPQSCHPDEGRVSQVKLFFIQD